MGWGGARVGAGRKPKSQHAKWLAGKATRRAPDAPADSSSNLLDMPPVIDPRQGLGDGWLPTRAQRARLGSRGRQYVDDVTSRYDIAIHEGVLVLHIADHVDAIERLQLWQRKAKSTKERIAIEKLVLERQKIIRDLERQLNQGSTDAIESDGT